MRNNAQAIVRMAHPFLSPPEEIIDEARNGRIFILVDDEDRENEGDLIVPAQMATPDVINFMAKHGRGLVCLAMTKTRVDQLGLPLMSRDNGTLYETAFTISIESRDGVTTGISAADRARTIAVAIDAGRGRDDIVTPGHVFPLVARDGGVLVRAGHTEAAVDVARLAGLNPSGVICEIMNDDGTMSRMDDLIGFAQLHGLKIGTIRDLIAYRRRHDHLMERRAERQFESDWGGTWRATIFHNKITGEEQLALVKGTINPSKPVLVRMHQLDHFVDALGETSARSGLLKSAMQLMEQEGCGVVVLLADRRPDPLSKMFSAHAHKDLTADGEPADLRDYGIGAQILADLGIHEIVLLSNTQHVPVALAGHGLAIVDVRTVPSVSAAF